MKDNVRERERETERKNCSNAKNDSVHYMYTNESDYRRQILLLLFRIIIAKSGSYLYSSLVQAQHN